MDVTDIFQQIEEREKKAKKRALLFTFIPVLVGVALIWYTAETLLVAQQKLTAIDHSVDSLINLRDRVRIEYLEAKGFDFSKRKELLGESIKADSLLSEFLKMGNIKSTLQIKYYRKSLDQEKVWLSLKELGYKNIGDVKSTNSILLNDETNTIAFAADVPLFDIKVISLTLIRAGFKLQHLFFPQNDRSANLVQIVRTAPRDGSRDKTVPFTVDQIREATNIMQLVHQ